MTHRYQRGRCRLESTGIVCALGSDLGRIRERLLAPECDALVLRAGLLPDRELLVGAIDCALPEIPDRLAPLRCRNNALALAALRQIENRVRAAVERHGAARVGIVIGTTTSGVEEAADAVALHHHSGALPPAFDYAQLEHGGLATFLAESAGVTGPAYSISTACSSSAKALVSARSLLALDLCDAVIAGGVDTLCKLTTRGFTALEAIAPERSNPMSRNRRGLNLGEAAALFLVTRESGGIQLAGAGESSDAHHMSAPSIDGAGAESAMRAALADADARPEDLLYLNLHGTGTLLNDSSESAAVSRVLGDVHCSSTKPRVGHTLGAAGALEAAFCWLVLDGARGGARDARIALPPHDWDGERDPALAALHLVTPGESVPVRGRRLVASSSFGFGGNNCTLVLEHSSS